MPISNVNTSTYVPRQPPQTRADTMDKLETKARNEPPPKLAEAKAVERQQDSQPIKAKGQHVDRRA
jgi:hypothetical protein